MKKQIILFIALLWGGLGYAQKRESGNLVLENIPEASAQMLERLDQYQNVRNATFADWDTKGEGILIATRFGDVPQIHYVQRPGGSRQQLTFEREPIGGATVCPDASKQGFIFSRDAGGNENFQVPNVRGSTGYGKTYVKLDNGFLRENSVKDIGALLD